MVSVVKTFPVDSYYDDEVFEEIEDLEELHDILPRLCFPAFQSEDFFNLPIIEAEDHGNLILWWQADGIQVIDIMGADTNLRPQQEDYAKTFGLFQAAKLLQPVRQTVGETGAFYTVFTDLRYWSQVSKLLEVYVPQIQAALKKRFKLDPEHPNFEADLKNLTQVLNYQRTTNIGKLDLIGLDRNLVLKYLDDIDELCWYLAEMLVEHNELPDYLTD